MPRPITKLRDSCKAESLTSTILQGLATTAAGPHHLGGVNEQPPVRGADKDVVQGGGVPGRGPRAAAAGDAAALLAERWLHTGADRSATAVRYRSGARACGGDIALPSRGARHRAALMAGSGAPRSRRFLVGRRGRVASWLGPAGMAPGTAGIRPAATTPEALACRRHRRAS
jgi:hypothetical protein